MPVWSSFRRHHRPTVSLAYGLASSIHGIIAIFDPHARVITPIKPTRYFVVTKLAIMIMFARAATYFVKFQDGIFGCGDAYHRSTLFMFLCGRGLWTKSDIRVITFFSDTCGGGNPEPRCSIVSVTKGHDK